MSELPGAASFCRCRCSLDARLETEQARFNQIVEVPAVDAAASGGGGVREDGDASGRAEKLDGAEGVRGVVRDVEGRVGVQDVGECGWPVGDVALGDQSVGDVWAADRRAGRRLLQYLVPGERVRVVNSIFHPAGASLSVLIRSVSATRSGW